MTEGDKQILRFAQDDNGTRDDNVQSFVDSFCLALERSHHPAQYASSVILSEALVLSNAPVLSLSGKELSDQHLNYEPSLRSG